MLLNRIFLCECILSRLVCENLKEGEFERFEGAASDSLPFAPSTSALRPGHRRSRLFAQDPVQQFRGSVRFHRENGRCSNPTEQRNHEALERLLQILATLCFQASRLATAMQLAEVISVPPRSDDAASRSPRDGTSADDLRKSCPKLAYHAQKSCVNPAFSSKDEIA